MASSGSARAREPRRHTEDTGDTGDTATGTEPFAVTRGSAIRAVTTALLPIVFTAMPMFLVSTLAVRLRRDFGFDEAALGSAVAMGTGTTAFVAMFLGRLVQRIGPNAGLRLGAVTSAASLCGIALLAESWAVLAAFLVVGGVAGAITIPASDLWLSRTIPPRRQGLAFGVKQAGGPAAALVAGVAVPALAATFGWRWAFAAASVGAMLAALAVPRAGRRSAAARRRGSRRGSRRDGDVAIGPLIVLTFAMGLGLAAAVAFTTFLVSAAVAGGMDDSTAGLLFAFGSLVGIGARVLLGHLADRRTDNQLTIIAALLAVGSGGFLLLSTQTPALMVVATPIVFMTAWGWTGIFLLALVRVNPNAPAAASGIAITGGYAGMVVGPVAFGLLVRHSYTLAWSAAAATSLAAAVVMFLAGAVTHRGGHVPGGTELAPVEAPPVVRERTP